MVPSHAEPARVEILRFMVIRSGLPCCMVVDQSLELSCTAVGLTIDLPAGLRDWRCETASRVCRLELRGHDVDMVFLSAESRAGHAGRNHTDHRRQRVKCHYLEGAVATVASHAIRQRKARSGSGWCLPRFDLPT